MRDVSRASHELERVKLRPLGSNKNIDDQSDAKRTGILSGLLLDELNERSGKPAISYFIFFPALVYSLFVTGRRRNGSGVALK